MRARSGFTLVELSIVLVIIGLLTGGVLTGQSLIRAAELRSVTSQYSRYIAAVQTFRDKYFAIPGDMTNATKYWGAVASGTACVTTASTSTATCDGDGNGWVEYSNPNSNESFRFWQHLANAGLIEGSYDGIAHGGTLWSSTVANAPAGRITSSGWFAFHWGALAGVPYAFDGQYDNGFQVGGFLANYDPIGSIFKPEEVYNIDQKMDDGKPATGKVVARAGGAAASANLNTCTDTSSTTNLSANYALSSTAPGCAIMFRQQF